MTPWGRVSNRVCTAPASRPAAWRAPPAAAGRGPAWSRRSAAAARRRPAVRAAHRLVKARNENLLGISPAPADEQFVLITLEWLAGLQHADDQFGPALRREFRSTSRIGRPSRSWRPTSLRYASLANSKTRSGPATSAAGTGIPLNSSCSTVSRWLELRPRETGPELTVPPRASPQGVCQTPRYVGIVTQGTGHLTLGYPPRVFRVHQQVYGAKTGKPAGSSGWTWPGPVAHPDEHGMSRLVHPPGGGAGR